MSLVTGRPLLGEGEGSSLSPAAAWRHPFSIVWLTTAVLRVAWPVLAATASVCALAIAGRLIDATAAISLALFGSLLFLFSLYMHELAHILIICAGETEIVLIQKGLRLGILHRKLSPRSEIDSALAGPCCGFISCLLVAAFSFVAHQESYFAVSLAIACFHVLGLLPWYGDGRSLLTALKESRDASRT